MGFALPVPDPTAGTVRALRARPTLDPSPQAGREAKSAKSARWNSLPASGEGEGGVRGEAAHCDASTDANRMRDDKAR